jgi:Zinc finger C-x8-C-x5-C-x3-H type (and similar)
MSSFGFTQYLAPANYIEIIQSIEYLKINDEPRNELERCLQIAIQSSIKTESIKPSAKPSTKTAVKEAVTAPFQRGKKLCIHNRNGTCRFGAMCTYLHLQCNKNACREHAQDNCKFGHTIDQVNSANQDDEQDEEDQEEEDEDSEDS